MTIFEKNIYDVKASDLKDYALGHEFLNYLHHISLQLQIGRSTSEVLEYIEELAASINEVKQIVKNANVMTALWLQSRCLQLISAGYKLICNDISEAVNLTSFDTKIYDYIVESVTSEENNISNDDKLIEVGINNNGKLVFSFPYVEKNIIMDMLKKRDHIIIEVDQEKIGSVVSI